ncbi:hypothetical protein BJ944DRAFT_262332 [Cunninghamella echinulata]|nr:hypothetical protein BJ944DRAFT_262332 [Cunninghamella echinulata]
MIMYIRSDNIIQFIKYILYLFICFLKLFDTYSTFFTLFLLFVIGYTFVLVLNIFHIHIHKLIYVLY